MRTVKYKNTEGTEIVFSNQAPFILQNVEGFGGVSNEIHSQRQFNRPGEQFISQSLEVRNIVLEGLILAKTDEDLDVYRRELVKAFNPMLAGTIIYRNDSEKEYEIDVVVDFAPNLDNQLIGTRIPFQIQLKALDVFWRDVSYYDSLIPLSQKVNLFKFPLQIVEDFQFAAIKSGEIIELQNDGDADVGAIFTIKFFADVVNPRIYNVITQEYFGFVGTYGIGTTLTISTVRGNKFVVKDIYGVETNAMSERSLSSTFLQVRKGSNYFQVQADSRVNATIADLKFTPLVLGV